MAARGEELDRLMGLAARLRDLDTARSSPIRARCSSRSRCCAATTATTARSRSRPPSSTPPSSHRKRRSRSPTPAAGWAARKRCSPWATGRRNATTSRASGSKRADTAPRSDYVRAVAIRVIEETGLLPHLNPGVMSLRGDRPPEAGERLDGHDARDVARCAWPSAAVRTSGRRTRCRRCGCARSRTPGGSPCRSPPASWWASARPIASEPSRCSRSATLHRRYRHVQEVIVQNFRAKPGTAMQAAPEPDDEEFLAAVATARVVLGPRMHLQAPPNLSRPGPAAPPARRRHRRLGRRLAAHPRPREPGEALALDRGPGAPPRPRGANSSASASRSIRRSRPSPIPYLAGKMRAPVAALLGPDGRAVEGQASGTDRVAGPRRPVEAPDDRAHVRQGRRTRACARTRMTVYGDADTPEATRAWSTRDVASRAARSRHRGRARRRPKPIDRSPTKMRSRCSGPKARRSMRSVASPTTCVPRPSATTSPTSSTGTSTSRTSATWGAGSARSRSARWMPSPTRSPSTEVADRAEEAWELGCHRGVHAGRHPSRPARARSTSICSTR